MFSQVSVCPGGRQVSLVPCAFAGVPGPFWEGRSLGVCVCPGVVVGMSMRSVWWRGGGGYSPFADTWHLSIIHYGIVQVKPSGRYWHSCIVVSLCKTFLILTCLLLNGSTVMVSDPMSMILPRVNPSIGCGTHTFLPSSILQIYCCASCTCFPTCSKYNEWTLLLVLRMKAYVLVTSTRLHTSLYWWNSTIFVFRRKVFDHSIDRLPLRWLLYFSCHLGVLLNEKSYMWCPVPTSCWMSYLLYAEYHRCLIEEAIENYRWFLCSQL